MATEYRLSYTASEINKKLGQVDTNKDELNKANQDIVDLNRQINVERERINTFTALSEGSTTGDAELVDARIDKDGNAHANVGDHIRSVTGQLSEQIDDVMEVALQIPKFWSNARFVNGNVSPDGSTIETYPSRIATPDSIVAESGCYFRTKSPNAFAFHFFDIDGNRIGGTTWVTEHYVEKGTIFKMNINKSGFSGTANVDEFKAEISCMMPVKKILLPNNTYTMNFEELNVAYERRNISDGVLSEDLYSNRISTSIIHSFPYKATLSVKDGYSYALHYYNENDEYTHGTPWLFSDITLERNQKFRMIVRTVNNDTLNDDLVKELTEVVTAYFVDVDRKELFEYSYEGEKLDVERHGYNVDLAWQNQKSFDDGQWRSAQGCAIYGDILFHHYNLGSELSQPMRLFDVYTGDLIAEYEAEVGHGCGSTFSKEFFAADDEFPLLYTDRQTEPQSISVNRVTRTGATLIKTIVLPESAGYWSKMCIVPDRNIIWNVGQVNRSTTQKVDTIVTGWDLNELTDNGDGTFTPKLIKTFKGPKSTFNQTSAWFNGRIYFLCSSWGEPSAHPTEIFVIDPDAERVVSVLSNFPSEIKDTEMEGIAFLLNEETNKYDMLFTTHSIKVYKLSFY